MDYCMLSFVNTHVAITAQQLLKSVCPTQTMPVLREISAGCGIAVRFPPKCLDLVQETLQASPLSTDDYSFYAVTGSGTNLSVKKL